ncbi:DUF2568 domain-containing protein [Nocardioides sp. SR21]|uniref:DUF2568 domain-containing protein n=1 Tax=Nocardioides sp. SR21 TaxID=2919501 RepID=UPI001FA9C68B|nr:DUF2568 domain-containing protein [Nocardioides sp. SR21]
MKVFGWTVLALVFVSELLAIGGLFVWGLPSLLWSFLLGAAGLLAWNFFASPKARFGHPVGRPVVKVLVFGLGSYGYWVAGYPTLAVVVLVLSVVVNALALLPSVSGLVDELG